MGEYYNWINIDKREYISPSAFDYGSKYYESMGRDNSILSALRYLLANEWKNCRIAWMGDECSVPDNSTTTFFQDLSNSFDGLDNGGIFDNYFEKYKNVSGLFKINEAEIRNEYELYLADIENGFDLVDEYGFGGKKDPFEGMFQKEGMTFEYTINYSKKICYNFKKTRILHRDGRQNNFIDPLPVLLGYGRMQPEPGKWLGDIVGVSNEIDESIKVLDSIHLDF